MNMSRQQIVAEFNKAAKRKEELEAKINKCQGAVAVLKHNVNSLMSCQYLSNSERIRISNTMLAIVDENVKKGNEALAEYRMVNAKYQQLYEYVWGPPIV